VFSRLYSIIDPKRNGRRRRRRRRKERKGERIQNSKNLGLAFEKGRERGENKNSLVHEDIINPRENRRGERRKNDSAGYFVLE
jgi:hypothetical protein